MKRNRGLFTVFCLSGILLLAGCATPPWGAKPAEPSAGALNPDSVLTPGATKPVADAKTNPNDKSAKPNRLAMARLCERRNQQADALRLYQEVSQETPNNPAPYHRMAVIYCKQGKFKEADENFQRAIALAPNNPELLSDAGYCLHLSNRPVDAERLLRRAMELEPANRTYCNNLAVVLGNLGRHDESLALFRRGGSEKQASANHAYVLAQRGEYQQAFDIYDRLLTEDQSNRVAADAMIELAKFVPRTPPKAPAKPESQSALATVTTRGVDAPGRPAMATSVVNGPLQASASATQVAVAEEIPVATPSVPPTNVSRAGVSCVFAGPEPATATHATVPASGNNAPAAMIPPLPPAAGERSQQKSTSFADRIAILLVVGLVIWGSAMALGLKRTRNPVSVEPPPLPNSQPATRHRPLGGLHDAILRSATTRPVRE